MSTTTGTTIAITIDINKCAAVEIIPTNARITEDDQLRITEAGQTRLVEGE